MRLNKFIAHATGISRRAADGAIAAGKVRVNGQQPTTGMQVSLVDRVTLDGTPLSIPESTTTVLLNKPVGYVCSRNGQGSPTIYELLPQKFSALKPVGRLDKDSSGLILVTDDGDLSQQLTHPSREKAKVYIVTLDKPLTTPNQKQIDTHQVRLEDGFSGFNLLPLDKQSKKWRVTMTEGRNRQVRRTFRALGYKVTHLHRVQIGDFLLGDISSGSYLILK